MNLHVFLCLGPVSGVLCVALNEPSYVSVFTTTTKWCAMCYLLYHVNFYVSCVQHQQVVHNVLCAELHEHLTNGS